MTALDLPDVGADTNTWGTKLNAVLAALEAADATKADAAATTAALAAKADAAATTTALASKLSTTAASGTYAPAEFPAAALSALATHAFVADRSLYNATPNTLRRWFAALSRAEAGGVNAHLACVGDSTVWGAAGATPYTTQSWPGRLRTMVAKRFGDVGGLGVEAFIDLANATANPLVVATGFTRDGARGVFNSAYSSTAASQTLVYGPIVTAGFKIYYANRAGGGAFTYKIDSGSTTTVNTANATESIQSVTVTASSTASHSLTITSSDTSPVTILAVEAYTATTGGVKVSRLGQNGAKAGDAITSTNPTSSLYAVTSMAAPDLVAVCLEVNDWLTSTSTATYSSRLATLIDQVRAVNADVLLIACAPPDPTLSTATLAAYSQVLYQLADSKNVALLDLQHRWSSYSLANAAPYSFMGDDRHPSSRGYFDIARAVFAAVFGNWQSTATVSLSAKQSWTAMQTFGYPGNGAEQLQVGGYDLLTSTSDAFVATDNGGRLRVASKSGQVVYVDSPGVDVQGGNSPGTPSSGRARIWFDATNGVVKVNLPDGSVKTLTWS